MVIDNIVKMFADRGGFFIETISTEEAYPSSLYGPLAGDKPVSESDVTYGVRGDRGYESRLIDKPSRQVNQLTVIAGPDGEGHSCVLYTAYGGPCAPKEPLTPGITPEELVESKEFWEEHALAIGD